MKFIIISLLLGVHAADAVMHSLKYFYTGSSQVPNFPEFVVVGMVDDLQIDYYDSITKRTVPKQDWMNKAAEGYPQYWEDQTARAVGAQHGFKANIDILKQRFNQSGGMHIYQYMYGCEWDDETGETEGYNQDGYDGEDFLVLDLKNMRYITPSPQAVITKNKFNNNRARLEYKKHYYTQTCIEWLKKYLNYGKNTLQRTVPPTVSLLQKSPSSPVTCHATGFYPNGVMVFWRRDGDQVFEDVDHGEILLNHDGTFQNSVAVPVKPEDWDSGKLECVVQIAGIDDDFITVLTPSVVMSNSKKPVPDGTSVPTELIIGGVVGALLLVISIISGVVIWKKVTEKKASDDASRGSSEIHQELCSKPGPKTSSADSEEKQRLQEDVETVS